MQLVEVEVVEVDLFVDNSLDIFDGKVRTEMYFFEDI